MKWGIAVLALLFCAALSWAQDCGCSHGGPCRCYGVGHGFCLCDGEPIVLAQSCPNGICPAPARRPPPQSPSQTPAAVGFGPGPVPGDLGSRRAAPRPAANAATRTPAFRGLFRRVLTGNHR